MFCPNCGNNIDPASQFCPNCGTKISSANQPFQQPMLNQQPQQPKLPMKWFNFLIYFALWAGGILNIISGILTFKSAGLFIELTIVNYAYGLALIALGVFGIYTRFRLAGYYKNGPQLLLYLYGANAVITVAYTVATYFFSLTKGFAAIADIIPSIIVSCVMVGVNNVYFQKRSDLFTK